jgi:hypothetical protein
VSATRALVWSNRHALGAPASQTRAPAPGIVTAEGGGFIPTLTVGGGVGVSRSSQASGRGRS